MKKRISKRELKRIRRDIEALPGRYDTGQVIPVSIALPEPCDCETREYADYLIRELKKVKCNATISYILSFSRQVTSDKPYEVLPKIPIATPCIRVYPHRGHKQGNLLERIQHTIKNLRIVHD